VFGVAVVRFPLVGQQCSTICVLLNVMMIEEKLGGKHTLFDIPRRLDAVFIATLALQGDVDQTIFPIALCLRSPG
jgi:hypothetical protein